MEAMSEPSIKYPNTVLSLPSWHSILDLDQGRPLLSGPENIFVLDNNVVLHETGEKRGQMKF